MKNLGKFLQKLFIMLFLAMTMLSAHVVFGQGNDQKKFLYQDNLYSQGQNWVKISPNFSTGDTILDMSRGVFVTNNIGWFVPNYSEKLFKTTDGGYNWILQKELPQKAHYQLFALDSLQFWVYSSGGLVIFTFDGGINWDSSRIDSTNSEFGSLFFFSAQEGMAFNRYPWLTTDGGRTWVVVDTDSIEFFCPTDAYFVNRKVGWVVGQCTPIATHAGFIAKTIDGGNRWIYQGDTIISNLPPSLLSVDFLDTLTGFAVGNNNDYSSGFILSTKNGGQHWEQKQIIGSLGFYDVGFLNKSLGWITGDSGRIWQTTDGGENWSLQNTGINVSLKKISVLRQEKFVYIFGENNTLLRADLVTSIDEDFSEIPIKFSLSQNYPNPFNSYTVIEYAIDQTSPVQLKIFNILGREVRTLTNEIQIPGRYRVVWDGSTNEGGEFSSGIYIYRLTVGSRMAYRKMVFIK